MTHPSHSGNTSEWELMRRHFSDERLRLYLTEANGDEDAAAHLYQWNSRCSAAFWEALGYLEVSLRNALDARLTLRQHKQGQTRHWVFDDARQLGRDARGVGRHAHPYQGVATAIRRVQANGKPLDPAQIISELPFGFWHQLVARRQMFLWPDLAAAFAHAPSRSQFLCGIDLPRCVICAIASATITASGHSTLILGGVTWLPWPGGSTRSCVRGSKRTQASPPHSACGREVARCPHRPARAFVNAG